MDSSLIILHKIISSKCEIIFRDGEYPNQIEFKYFAMSEMLLRVLWQQQLQSHNWVLMQLNLIIEGTLENI